MSNILGEKLENFVTKQELESGAGAIEDIDITGNLTCNKVFVTTVTPTQSNELASKNYVDTVAGGGGSIWDRGVIGPTTISPDNSGDTLAINNIQHESSGTITINDNVEVASGKTVKTEKIENNANINI